MQNVNACIKRLLVHLIGRFQHHHVSLSNVRMLFAHMVLECKGSRVRGTALCARVFECVIGPFVAFHVRFDSVQRGKWTIAFGAGERLGVAVLVAGQLDVRLERFRAERTLERTKLRVGEQVVVVHGVRFVAEGEWKKRINMFYRFVK